MRTFFLIAALLLACAPSILAAAEAPLRVCLISGAPLYESDASLAAFQKYLESRYHASTVMLKARGDDDLPGLEALDDCDTALFFTRRLKIDGEQLERIKAYCQAGRPLVAVRTASHGFQHWLAWDRDVLGGDYDGHFPEGPTAQVVTADGARDHAILDGLIRDGFPDDFPVMKSRGSLYKNAAIVDDATPLLLGFTAVSNSVHPVAWTRERHGGRVFYTSLGAREDFESGAFRRMLAQALFWSARRDLAPKPLPPPPERETPGGVIRLSVRTRVETTPGAGEWREQVITRELPVAETAILICDMWDLHWCGAASRRVDAMVDRMNDIVRAARAKGVRIIHCPSETLDFYADTPQRRRVQLAPAVAMPRLREIPCGPMPITVVNEGCDSDEPPWHRAWTRQHPAIEIGPLDAVGDQGGEIYSFLASQGINHIIYMGVHTNMCVLNRSFAIRPMTEAGKHCYLVRDLTDALYRPQDPPFVSHDEGTQLVVKYIEQHWAPSITSDQLLEGLP